MIGQVLHRPRIAAAVAAIVALSSALGAATAQAAPPGVVKLTDTQLDPTALFFVSFDGLVNNASYQQSAIVSRAGFQYAAWYTASRAGPRSWRGASCRRARGRPWCCRTS